MAAGGKWITSGDPGFQTKQKNKEAISPWWKLQSTTLLLAVDGGKALLTWSCSQYFSRQEDSHQKVEISKIHRRLLIFIRISYIREGRTFSRISVQFKWGKTEKSPNEWVLLCTVCSNSCSSNARFVYYAIQTSRELKSFHAQTSFAAPRFQKGDLKEPLESGCWATRCLLYKPQQNHCLAKR